MTSQAGSCGRPCMQCTRINSDQVAIMAFKQAEAMCNLLQLSMQQSVVTLLLIHFTILKVADSCQALPMLAAACINALWLMQVQGMVHPTDSNMVDLPYSLHGVMILSCVDNSLMAPWGSINS